MIGMLAGAIVSLSPASATPLGSATGTGLTVPLDDIVLVQGQGQRRRNANSGGGGSTQPTAGGGGGGGGQRVGRGGGGQRVGGGGGGGGNRGRNIGTGLAIGAGIGILGAIAVDQANRRQGAIEYCMSQFPNYDPQTQTGWDRRGRPYRCP